jgi:hypothetical protein
MRKVIVFFKTSLAFGRGLLCSVFRFEDYSAKGVWISAPATGQVGDDGIIDLRIHAARCGAVKSQVILIPY